MNNCMQLEVIQYTKGHGARGTKEGRPIKWIQLWAKSTWSEWQIEFNCLATWQKCSIFRFGQGCPLFARFVLFFFLSFLISFCLKLVFARHLTHLTMTPHSLGFSSLRLFLHPPRGPKSAALSTENVCRLGQHLRRLWKRPKRGLNGGPRAGSGSELAVINNIGAKKRTYDNLKYEIIYNY